eukprot:gnl/MRDRNA2_/MRDRNA2_77451_c0_seq2.p1 gnl/MRDRNA2_/MRDRNA2_77451_c0~~gnl/MRDRNA2_/MRDRNA2_77451_c0_seq2.p1  ORF type:complete len:351 (+),score=73.88 gnl/MRDRNA2_/MRDRNA2_77451_c0_seq2:114-1166(+)
MSSEKRVDPFYGKAYTFDEMATFYKGKYKKNAIKAYWETECKPVKKNKKSNNKKKEQGAAQEDIKGQENEGVPEATIDQVDTTADTCMPRIEGIFITPHSAAPMQRLEVANLIAGVGIDGDRYALGTGTYSAAFLNEPGRHLTMLSADGVEAEMAKAGLESVSAGDMRRNLVIRGLSAEALNDMVGHEVAVGSSCRLFVHRRTVPCKYREAQSKQPLLMTKLWDVCGVNCEILNGGEVSVGDSVTVVPDTHQPKRCTYDMGPSFFIHPSERTPEQVKEGVISEWEAMKWVVHDPVGFHRLEDAYRSVGVNFFSAKAFAAAMRTESMMKPVAYLTVAATVGVVALIAMRRR